MGVMPRTGSVDDLRWFTSDAAFVFHPMNAYAKEDLITCDVCQFGGADVSICRWRPGDPAKSFAQLTRWLWILGAR